MCVKIRVSEDEETAKGLQMKPRRSTISARWFCAGSITRMKNGWHVQTGKTVGSEPEKFVSRLEPKKVGFS